MGCLSLLYSPACGRLQINIARARVQNVDGRPLLKIAYSQFYAILCNPWIYSAMTIRSDPDFDKVHSLKEAQDWECDILGRIYVQKMTNWKDDNQNPSFESFCRRILLLKEGKMPKIGICLKDDTLETTSIGWLKNVKSQNKFLGKKWKSWVGSGRTKENIQKLTSGRWGFKKLFTTLEKSWDEAHTLYYYYSGTPLACELFFTFVSSPSLTTSVTDILMLMSFYGVLVQIVWVEDHTKSPQILATLTTNIGNFDHKYWQPWTQILATLTTNISNFDHKY